MFAVSRIRDSGKAENENGGSTNQEAAPVYSVTSVHTWLISFASGDRNLKIYIAKPVFSSKNVPPKKMAQFFPLTPMTGAI